MIDSSGGGFLCMETTGCCSGDGDPIEKRGLPKRAELIWPRQAVDWREIVTGRSAGLSALFIKVKLKSLFYFCFSFNSFILEEKTENV